MLPDRWGVEGGVATASPADATTSVPRKELIPDPRCIPLSPRRLHSRDWLRWGSINPADSSSMFSSNSLQFRGCSSFILSVWWMQATAARPQFPRMSRLSINGQLAIRSPLKWSHILKIILPVLRLCMCWSRKISSPESREDRNIWSLRTASQLRKHQQHPALSTPQTSHDPASRGSGNTAQNLIPGSAQQPEDPRTFLLYSLVSKLLSRTRLGVSWKLALYCPKFSKTLRG